MRSTKLTGISLAFASFALWGCNAQIELGELRPGWEQDGGTPNPGNPIPPVSDCYEPDRNVDLAYTEGAVGCACRAPSRVGCVRNSRGGFASFVCDEETSRWEAVDSSRCSLDGGVPSRDASVREASVRDASARDATPREASVRDASARDAQLRRDATVGVDATIPPICPALDAPEGGDVVVDGLIASYSCKPERRLVGATRSRCQVDGTWSAEAPRCDPVVDCGLPRGVMDGTVVAPTTTYGSVATVVCRPGYAATQGGTLTCQERGSWENKAIRCLPQSCKNQTPGAGVDCGSGTSLDCCMRNRTLVAGGTFNRDNDDRYPATVSAFELDKFEITVGRFRAFVEAGMGTQANPPPAGAGANPHIPGSGWDPAWNANLVAQDLASAVQCDSRYQTWTGNNDRRPMNCISWYEAFAFCVWDGGRLPTELEWNAAAVGGDEQRPYPWGLEEPGRDARLAIHGCFYGAEPGVCSSVANIAEVGFAPAGDGRWRHSDLAGSLWEWTLDSYSRSYPCEGCAAQRDYPATCTDCATLTPGTYRAARGAGFENTVRPMAMPNAGGEAAAHRTYRRGARCASDPFRGQ